MHLNNFSFSLIKYEIDICCNYFFIIFELLNYYKRLFVKRSGNSINYKIFKIL